MKEWICNFWATYQGAILQFGKKILLIIVILVLAWLCVRLLKALVKKIADKVGHCDVAAERLICVSCRYVVGFFAILIILDLFGVNTASLLAVLGTAGLAIGLALKNTLSNMAAGLVLLIIRPYNPGDFISSGVNSGTVETMGLFTTTLRTADGAFISVPNNLLWALAVTNHSRSGARRAEFTVTASYTADVDKDVERLVAILSNYERILKDPAPQVTITDFDDNNVTLKVNFWAAKSDYVLAYCDVKRNLDSMLNAAGFNA